MRTITSRGQQGATKASSLPKAKLEERAGVYSLPRRDRAWVFWQISTTSGHSPALQRHVGRQKRSPPRLQNLNPRCGEEGMRWSCGPGGRCGEWTHRRPDSGLSGTTPQSNFSAFFCYIHRLQSYTRLTQILRGSDWNKQQLGVLLKGYWRRLVT